MKRVNLVLAAIFVFPFTFSQTDQQKKDLELFKNDYKIDGENVIFTKVLEDITGTKDEIFTKVISYFAVAYKSANDVIQQQDKDAGVIIGKGIFDVHKDSGFGWSLNVNCDHTIRVDIRDGRVRVVLSVNEYNWDIKGSQPSYNKYKIIDNYPINEKSKWNRKGYSDVFIGLCLTVNRVFNNIETSLKNENPISGDDDW